MSVALAGCSGDEDTEARLDENNRRAVARAWVAALNREDYERACELSENDDKAACVHALEKKPFGKGDLEISGEWRNKGHREAGGYIVSVIPEADASYHGGGKTVDIVRVAGKYRVDYRIAFASDPRELDLSKPPACLAEPFYPTPITAGAVSDDPEEACRNEWRAGSIMGHPKTKSPPSLTTCVGPGRSAWVFPTSKVSICKREQLRRPFL